MFYKRGRVPICTAGADSRGRDTPRAAGFVRGRRIRGPCAARRRPCVGWVTDYSQVDTSWFVVQMRQLWSEKDPRLLTS